MQTSPGKHILISSKKCFYVTACLCRLRQLGYPLDYLLLIYNSLFLPSITYCISIWGAAYGNMLGGLQIWQNDAVKATFGDNSGAIGAK